MLTRQLSQLQLAIQLAIRIKHESLRSSQLLPDALATFTLPVVGLTRFCFRVNRLLFSTGKPKGTTVEHLLRRLSEASRPRRSPSPSPSSSPRVHSHLSPGVRSNVRSSPGFGSGGQKAGRPSAPSSGGNSPGGNSSGGVNAPSERYPARVFLCAFMILGHQEAVFNERGECIYLIQSFRHSLCIYSGYAFEDRTRKKITHSLCLSDVSSEEHVFVGPERLYTLSRTSPQES
jgi:hypothetical protein